MQATFLRGERRLVAAPLRTSEVVQERYHGVGPFGVLLKLACFSDSILGRAERY